MNILLDMDGVLVDFVDRACVAHCRQNPYCPLTPEWAGQFDMAKGWKMNDEEFWGPLNNEYFWSSMEWMPNGRQILQLCECYADKLTLLSTPTLSPTSCSGKHLWIKKHLPQFERQFLLGAPKEVCANSNSILVDDNDKNIERFVQAGGHGVLVPRPWNALYDRESFEYVEFHVRVACTR